MRQSSSVWHHCEDKHQNLMRLKCLSFCSLIWMQLWLTCYPSWSLLLTKTFCGPEKKLSNIFQFGAISVANFSTKFILGSMTTVGWVLWIEFSELPLFHSHFFRLRNSSCWLTPSSPCSLGMKLTLTMAMKGHRIRSPCSRKFILIEIIFQEPTSNNSFNLLVVTPTCK